jgi:hypothetical protein
MQNRQLPVISDQGIRIQTGTEPTIQADQDSDNFKAWSGSTLQSLYQSTGRFDQ